MINRMDILNQKRFSIREAAQKTGKSRSWWQNKINQNEVCYIKIGGRKFLPEDSVNSVVEVINPTKLSA